MWQALFDITNVIALVGWAMLILLPRRESVLFAVLYGAIGLLCACYVVMLVSLVGNLVDPVPAAGRAALADAAPRSVPADDHGAALLLPLECDGRVEIDQSRAAVDGP